MLPSVVQATQDWYAGAGEKESALMVMSSKGPAGAPVVIVAAFYNGEEEIGRQKFAK